VIRKGKERKGKEDYMTLFKKASVEKAGGRKEKGGEGLMPSPP